MRQSAKETVQQLSQTGITSGPRELLALLATEAHPGGTGVWGAMERSVPNPWVWKPGR